MLDVESQGKVLRVTMNRPEVRNAFNAELISQLRAVFSHVDDDIRAIVLSGRGPAFCSGGDLEWMRSAAKASPEENERDALLLAELFQSITQCHAVVIAMVQGACFGGGCGLVAAADIAIAATDAQFAFSEVRLGLVPATISPFVLPKIGAGHARHLFTTGEVFTGDHAARIGLVHDAVPYAELDIAVDRRLKLLLSGGVLAVKTAKTLASSPPLGLAEAAQLLATVRSRDEAQEGISAFLDKRKAYFVEKLEPRNA